MDKLKIKNRRQLLKVWLIAIACQTGQLFAQLKDSLYEIDSISLTPRELWDRSAPDYSMNENVITPQQNIDWQPPEGIRYNQIQSDINPETPEEYPHYPIQSHFSNENLFPIPKNGQWPAYSINSGIEERANPDGSTHFSYEPPSYYAPDPRSLNSPQNGQWPAYSINPGIEERANQDGSTHFSYEPPSYYAPDPRSLNSPQNGQWPAYSINPGIEERANQDGSTHFSYEPPSYYAPDPRASNAPQNGQWSAYSINPGIEERANQDGSTHFSYEPPSYYAPDPRPSNAPQNKQWPAYSINSRIEERANTDGSTHFSYEPPSYAPDPRSLNGPQNGQWPAYSINSGIEERANKDGSTHFSYEPPSYYAPDPRPTSINSHQERRWPSKAYTEIEERTKLNSPPQLYQETQSDLPESPTLLETHQSEQWPSKAYPEMEERTNLNSPPQLYQETQSDLAESPTLLETHQSEQWPSKAYPEIEERANLNSPPQLYQETQSDLAESPTLLETHQSEQWPSKAYPEIEERANLNSPPQLYQESQSDLPESPTLLKPHQSEQWPFKTYTEMEERTNLESAPALPTSPTFLDTYQNEQRAAESNHELEERAILNSPPQPAYERQSEVPDSPFFIDIPKEQWLYSGNREQIQDIPSEPFSYPFENSKEFYPDSNNRADLFREIPQLNDSLHENLNEDKANLFYPHFNESTNIPYSFPPVEALQQDQMPFFEREESEYPKIPTANQFENPVIEQPNYPQHSIPHLEEVPFNENFSVDESQISLENGQNASLSNLEMYQQNVDFQESDQHSESSPAIWFENHPKEMTPFEFAPQADSPPPHHHLHDNFDFHEERPSYSVEQNDYPFLDTPNYEPLLPLQDIRQQEDPNLKNEKKPEEELTENFPSLLKGKSQIKIVKKTDSGQENEKKETENFIGKQFIADPVVGAIRGNTLIEENQSTHQPKLDLKTTASSSHYLSPSSLSSKNDDSFALISQHEPTREQAIKVKQASQTKLNQLSDKQDRVIAQALPAAPAQERQPTIITPPASNAPPQPLKEISVNFNNISIIEYIRFLSRISNKNFIFDDEDLQFNVTIVSEEPTTIENLIAALLQELKIRDLSLIEQGNNIIIHRNPRVKSPARIVSDGTEQVSTSESELVTRVFRLNTLDPIKASEIIRPLLSEDTLVEVLRDTNNLIITGLVVNVNKIAQLINTLDSPNSGITVGQFVVRNGFVDSLVDLANKILQPIAQGNPFVLVPHPVSNSIFIVSNSYIVEKALAILQNLDFTEGQTKILSLEGLQPSLQPEETRRAPGYRPGVYPGIPGYPLGIPPYARPGAPAVGVGGVETGGAAPAGARGALPGRETRAGELIGPGGELRIPPTGIPGAGVLGVGIPGAGIAPGAISPEEFIEPEAIPESFPLGGIGAEGGLLPALPPMRPGEYFFGPGGVGTEGRPSAIFDGSRPFQPGGIAAMTRWQRDLPQGHIERNLFFIYKLRYRKGDQIELALRKIGLSMQAMGTANIDLISAINSSQWIESSNALIFTGTPIALDKIRELILEIDTPLRQVFIEMLILDTSITDSLSYSVDWIDRFGGGTTTGEEGFLSVAPGSSSFPCVNNFVNNAGNGGGGIETIFPGGQVCPPERACPLPVATGFLNCAGFAAGIIGTHLTHNGTRFNSIGALLRAVHNDAKANIILNPKIITEDNNTAEIFVGSTNRYKTQSITNDLGTLVTNNFQLIDVGTTLRVTPLIGNNGTITLEIIQESTAASPLANVSVTTNQDFNLVEVLTKTRTVTKIHIPNGFFVILSGMIQDNDTRSYSRIPCLGGIPILGAVGKSQLTNDVKRNLMLFIRPLILDTAEDIEDVTRRQQKVYCEKSKFRRGWNYEIDESLNFLNIKPTDLDEIGCGCDER